MSQASSQTDALQQVTSTLFMSTGSSSIRLRQGRQEHILQGTTMSQQVMMLEHEAQSHGGQGSCHDDR